MNHAIAAHRDPESRINLGAPLDYTELQALIEQLQGDILLTQKKEYQKRALERAPKRKVDEAEIVPSASGKFL